VADGPGNLAVISHVKVFIAMVSTTVHSFTAQAQNAGDAIVIHLNCGSSMTITGVTITAPGWSLTPIGPLTGSMGTALWSQSFGAIAPDVASAQFAVTWSGGTCDSATTDLGDEFTGNSTGGGAATFDSHAEAFGTGNCVTTITTASADDAVWAACATASLQSIGSGYTKSADDGTGDWSEYKLTTDPAGSAESVTFTNNNLFVLTAATIKPR
jgi:hypothetical protein